LKEGEARPDFSNDWKNRSDIFAALERSMEWTRAEHARQFFPVEGVTQERVAEPRAAEDASARVQERRRIQSARRR
jgi:hypothetical protein